MRYDIWKGGERVAIGLRLADTAKRLGLDEDDVVWSVEIEGRCDTDEYTAVETGEPVPPIDPIGMTRGSA